MNLRMLQTVGLAIALGLASAAYAAEPDHGTTVPVPVLKTPGDAVNAMAYFQRGVDEHIAKDQLHQLHAYAFAARDAALKIDDLATTLPAEKSKALKEHLARIKGIAAQIDKYGDAGKAAEARQFAAKLKEESEAVQATLGITASTSWQPPSQATAP